jgi:hypothetical protein
VLIDEIVSGHSAARRLTDESKFLSAGVERAVPVLLDKRALADCRYPGKFGVAHFLRGQPVFEGHAQTYPV